MKKEKEIKKNKINTIIHEMLIVVDLNPRNVYQTFVDYQILSLKLYGKYR
jgi:hypothetical protein